GGMDEHDWLAKRFDENRTDLHSVAYRMLGTASEADDAVQAAWLKISRSDAREVENLGGWLTTVVARLCLDMLRSRKSRREAPLACPSPKLRPAGKCLICQLWSGENPSLMITLLLLRSRPVPECALSPGSH